MHRRHYVTHLFFARASPLLRTPFVRVIIFLSFFSNYLLDPIKYVWHALAFSFNCHTKLKKTFFPFNTFVWSPPSSSLTLRRSLNSLRGGREVAKRLVWRRRYLSKEIYYFQLFFFLHFNRFVFRAVHRHGIRTENEIECDAQECVLCILFHCHGIHHFHELSNCCSCVCVCVLRIKWRGRHEKRWRFIRLIPKF